MMMLKKLILLLFLPWTAAFVLPSQTRIHTPTTPTTRLHMALDNRSPELRKNVMAAAVSAAAMPALASWGVPILTSLAVTTTVTNDPIVLGSLFVGHWAVTNSVLQKFPDENEIRQMKETATK